VSYPNLPGRNWWHVVPGVQDLDNHMIDLAIIVSSLSFVFEIVTRSSSDGVYFIMGGKIVLVQRLTCLQRRWR
jgi:hypothetical protein